MKKFIPFCITLSIIYALQNVNSQINNFKSYIMIMNDGTSAEEMASTIRAMQDLSTNNLGQPSEIRMRTNLFPMLYGRISEDAVTMMNSLSIMRIIEEDAEVSLIESAIPDPLQRVVSRNLNQILGGSGGSADQHPTPFSSQTGNRMNLDIVDSFCNECHNDGFNPERNGTGVCIYILDTGINFLHEDFADYEDRTKTRAEFLYDAIDDFYRVNPQNGMDCNGHGTHVASLAVGAVSGIARNANVFSVRVLDCQGRGTHATVLFGMDRIIELHRKKLQLPISEYKGSIVVLSLSGVQSEASKQAIQRLSAEGIIVVTASGNVRRDACHFSPGSSVTNINVGAHDYVSNDGGKTCTRHVYWYDFLPSSPGMNYGNCVDILAPGENIWGADYNSLTEYVKKTGTSQAAPQVAGACAILLDLYPRRSAAEIKYLIIASSCDDVNKTKFPSNIKNDTKNRRLCIAQGVHPISNMTTTSATTRTTPTTTTSFTPTVPPNCNTYCPLDVPLKSLIQGLIVIKITQSQLKSVLTIRLNFFRQTVYRLSIYKNTITSVYHYIFVIAQLSDTMNMEYIFGEDDEGVEMEDFESVLATYNQNNQRTFTIHRRIPLENGNFYLLVGPEFDCTKGISFGSTELQNIKEINTKTIINRKFVFQTYLSLTNDALLYDDVSKISTPCFCKIRSVNITLLAQMISALENSQENILADIQSYTDSTLTSEVTFIVTICTIDCYTERNCLTSLGRSILRVNIEEKSLSRTLAAYKLMQYHPLAATTYFDNTKSMEFIIIYFIRFVQ